MRRMAEVTDVRAVSGDFLEEDEEDEAAISAHVVPPGVEVFQINGPFFLGAAETFTDTIGRVAGKPNALIIRLRKTPGMDATGLHALTDVVRRSRSALLDEIGEENVCRTMDEALARARAELKLRPLMGRGSGQRDAVA